PSPVSSYNRPVLGGADSTGARGSLDRTLWRVRYRRGAIDAAPPGRTRGDPTQGVRRPPLLDQGTWAPRPEGRAPRFPVAGLGGWRSFGGASDQHRAHGPRRYVPVSLHPELLAARLSLRRRGRRG